VTRPIRIAYCIDSMGIGGTELNALRTAERLDRTRFSISVVALNENGPLRARYDAAEIPVHHAPIRALYHPATALATGQLARHFARERVDIVHCHDPYTNVVAATAARVAGTRVVLASRRWWETPARARALGAANFFAYRVAHRVIANSPIVARSLQAKERVRADRITVVPNFVDDDAFMAPPASQLLQLRDELRLEEDALVVGVVARLRAPKDHATLLRAAQRLRRSYPNLRVIIVGDGPDRERLTTLTRELGIDPIVRFAGTRPPQPNLHHLFDVCVLPTLKEGFPNSVIEAMAAGRPVVASAVGGVPDAIIDGETGRLVPPGDDARLAAALEPLLANRAVRLALGVAGMRRVRQHFHARAVVDTLESHYERWAREGA
jgi:glycosyltransferase involved in cell wall biosynthesis